MQVLDNLGERFGILFPVALADFLEEGMATAYRPVGVVKFLLVGLLRE